MKKKIIYIGNFSFPFGNASGKRVYGNGKILEELNFDVIFIGMDNDIKSPVSLKETEKKYDNFKYYNLSYPKNTLEWIYYKKTFKKVISFLKDENLVEKIDTIIYYGNPRLSLFNYLLIKWCKKNNIKIISDCVDWLTVKTGNVIFDFVKWADTTYQKAYLNKKVDGVIAISTYLENYYRKYGVETVVIPPLSTNNLLNSEFSLNEDKKIKIIYAGIPFRKGKLLKNVDTLKDRIDKTIILLNKVKEKNVNFIFNIYGFTKEEYLKVIPTQEKYINTLGESICFHGHQTNDIVVKELKKSDFTILLRDIKRDTMAGFPTKVSESISYGVPVITTKTSDLDKYLVDGETIFFVDQNDLQKIFEILSKNKNEVIKFKSICQKENIFYYQKYINQFEKFLLKL